MKQLRMTADFSSELVLVRKEYSSIFKVLKKKTVNLEFCESDFQNQKMKHFFRYIKIERLYPLPTYTTRNVKGSPSSRKKIIRDEIQIYNRH